MCEEYTCDCPPPTKEERETIYKKKYLNWYAREACLSFEKQREYLLSLLKQYRKYGGIEKVTGGGIDRKVEYITWEQFYEETMAVWSW